MNPDAHTLWRAPRWTLPLLMAALAMVGPFAIDGYLPAFSGIAAALNATPLQMQQTLAAYLAGFAIMNLFHGAFADSFGRRPVVLWGMALFALASAGCALAPSVGWLIVFRALEGLTAGSGLVVSRAIVRDLFEPSTAQKVMAQVTLYFGIAPVIAPMVGGWLFVHGSWPLIFWMLAAGGAVLWWVNWRCLPETLHASQRQAFNLRHLMAGYAALLGHRRFLALAVASGVPFNGFFIYVLSAPVFLGEHLKLGPTHFFWFFTLAIGGIMGGAWISGRIAGRVHPSLQVRHGFVIMAVISGLNIGLNALLTPNALWAIPLISAYALGWSLTAPVLTLMILDLVPDRRGMASSLHACVGSGVNAAAAGLLAPLVMHSTVALAIVGAVMVALGWLAWCLSDRTPAD